MRNPFVTIYKMFLTWLGWAIDSLPMRVLFLSVSLPLFSFLLVRISQFGDITAPRFGLLLKDVFITWLSYLLAGTLIWAIVTKRNTILTGIGLALFGAFIHTGIEKYLYGDLYPAKENLYYDGLFAVVLILIFLNLKKAIYFIENWFDEAGHIQKLISIK